MKKIFSGMVLAFTGLSIFAAFQNCGASFKTIDTDMSSFNHEDPHLMLNTSSPNLNSDLTFSVHGASSSAQYSWSNTLSGFASGCTEKTSRTGSTYTVNCSQAGKLTVSLDVNDRGKRTALKQEQVFSSPSPSPTPTTIALQVDFEVKAGTARNPWNTTATIVETFVGQTLKIKNADTINHQLHTGGAPCPHAATPIAPGGTADCVISKPYTLAANGPIYDHLVGPTAAFYIVAYDGAQMYATSCASCHGALASSTKKGMTLESFNASIQNVAVMRGLSNLTTRQREALTFALK